MPKYEFSEGEHALMARQQEIAEWLLHHQEHLDELYEKAKLSSDQRAALGECRDTKNPTVYISMSQEKRDMIDEAMSKLEGKEGA